MLELATVETPAPGAGQVRIKVMSAGVNPVETYIRAGLYPQKATLPYTPGSDAAGIVDAVGEGTSGFSVGQRVYTAKTVTGSYAQYAVADASAVYPLPESADFDQGAALGVPYPTAYQALFHRAAALPGETVLVHGGSGGVGTAAIQFAVAAGMTVFATAGTAPGLELVRRQGAHRVFDHTDPGYVEAIRAAAAPTGGVHVILEMLANVNLQNDLTLLAPHGRVVVVGNRGRIEIDPRLTMGKDAAILGMTLFNATPAQLARIHRAIATGLTEGTLRPIVGRTFALHDAPAAHGAVLQPGAHGKIVLHPWNTRAG